MYPVSKLSPIAPRDESQERDHHRVEEELIAEHRDQDEGDDEDERDAIAVLADREDRHVGRIGGLVLTGFAIEHGTLLP